jgi:hypothetical protein
VPLISLSFLNVYEIKSLKIYLSQICRLYLPYMSLQYRCFCIAGDVDAAAGVATVTTATGGESTDPATTMEEFPFPVPAMAWSRRMA